MKKKRVLVIGAGVSGLMASLVLAEKGAQVSLFSMVPIRHSPSICTLEGINAVLYDRENCGSINEHVQDTIYGGDFLNHQVLVQEMCEKAPYFIRLLSRMGILFNRTIEGEFQQCKEAGATFSRTIFSGTTTGFSVLKTLEEQVRKEKSKGHLEKYERWEFLGILRTPSGKFRGIVAIHTLSMDIEVFQGDSLVVCTGGGGALFGRSSTSFLSTGVASSRLYEAGALYANGEFIQFSPTGFVHLEKIYSLCSIFLKIGGRIWTWKEGKAWYFLEEWYPKYGNLVAEDLVSRAIHQVIYKMNIKIDGLPVVYLDISHLAKEKLLPYQNYLRKIQDRSGINPYENPIPITPAVSSTLGGLWVDKNHETNISGIFAGGEVEYQYHGANGLGGNMLLSCLYGGMMAGNSAFEYALGFSKESSSLSTLSRAEKKYQEFYKNLLNSTGQENPYQIFQELRNIMDDSLFVVRNASTLKDALQKIKELKEKSQKLKPLDNSLYANESLLMAGRIKYILLLGEVMVTSALHREESRGSHFREDFPFPNHEKFLKTTMASHTLEGPKISYENVDISLIQPRDRVYKV